MQDKLETKVTAIYWPEERELTLFKRCVWVTMAKRRCRRCRRRLSS